MGPHAGPGTACGTGLSAAPRRFDRRDVDLPHPHHRLESAPGRRRVGIGDGLGEDARRDLPRQAPFVPAPAAGAFLAAVVDDGMPQAVGLGLVVGRDLEGKGFAVPEGRAAVQAEAGDALSSRIAEVINKYGRVFKKVVVRFGWQSPICINESRRLRVFEFHGFYTYSCKSEPCGHHGCFGVFKPSVSAVELVACRRLEAGGRKRCAFSTGRPRTARSAQAGIA